MHPIAALAGVSQCALSEGVRSSYIIIYRRCRNSLVISNSVVMTLIQIAYNYAYCIWNPKN